MKFISLKKENTRDKNITMLNTEKIVYINSHIGENFIRITLDNDDEYFSHEPLTVFLKRVSDT